MKKENKMDYISMLDFVKEMAWQGYIADVIKSDWASNGIGFTNDEKNIYVLCYFEPDMTMVVYPNVPFLRSHKEEFDCYLNWFEEVRKEVNNAYEHLSDESNRLALKYGTLFDVSMIQNYGEKRFK